MNNQYRLGLISLAHVVLCIFSGALGWQIQAITVITSGAAAIFYVHKITSRKKWEPLLVIAPFYLLFIPVSLTVGTISTYPIWLCGLISCAVSHTLLYHGYHLKAFAIFLFLFALFNWYLVMPNMFAYAGIEKIKPEWNSLNNLQITDVQGQRVNLNDLRGKIVVLDIWSTSCLSCIRKFPEFEKLKEYYWNDSSVVLATLNMPFKKETPSFIYRFTSNYSFTKLSFESYEEAKKAGVSALPLLLIMDKNLNCRYAGGLHFKWNEILVNNKRLINSLKKEL